VINPTKAEHLAREIQRLIQEEDYSAAQRLLPSFAEAVTGDAGGQASLETLEGAARFLRSAARTVKVQRSHHAVALEELRGKQNTSPAIPGRHTIDLKA
jgi:hypothetical protein